MPRSKVFIGIIWASIQKFGTLAISFIANMVLARLLTPDDFGAIGMLTIFITLSQTLVDSGFGAALIQKKTISDSDTSTVFYINLGISVLLYILLYVVSPNIATFYKIPELCNYLRVLSIVILINAWGVIQSAQLARSLNFKVISICHLIGALIGVSIGIIAAYLDFGVWSIIIRTLLTALVTNILLWYWGKWKPKLSFSLLSFRELFSFGSYMMLSNIILNISNNIQSLIIGKYFSQSNVGNYTQAKTLRDITSEGISSVVGQVLYPDFSRYQNDNNTIADKLNKSMYLLSYIVFPLMLFMCVVADKLIPLIYGDQWYEAINYFRILCVGGIPLCLQRVNASVIQAKGRSRLFFICNVVKLVVYVPLLILGGIYGGMNVFLWVMVIYSTLAYLVFAFIATRSINTRLIDQIIIIFKCLVIAIAASGVITFCNIYIYTSYNVLYILIDFFLFMLSYLLISYLFRVKGLYYLISNIKTIYKR